MNLRKAHKYEINEIVGDMMILEHLFVERVDNGSYRKEYSVICVVCRRQKQMIEDKILEYLIVLAVLAIKV